MANQIPPTPSYQVAVVPTYVMLDLETTGATATVDRITEIALVRVENGIEVGRFSSLINPGVPIPPFIERLTGINNAMVEDAPSFKQLADQIRPYLTGAVLMAHNVRFDYGFLKNAFDRLDEDLRIKTLCTVRLSRQLYPEFKSHGLDALMQRHGLTTLSRHRAMGDVELVLAWLKQAEADKGLDAVQQAGKRLLGSSSSLPSHLQTPVKSIPDRCGVYIFYGESPLPLYVGKSVSMRTRVMSHFQADHKVSKEMRIAQEITRIEWQETAGELGALLLEARLIKQMQPVYNQQLRRQNHLCGWLLAAEPTTQPQLTLATMGGPEAIDLEAFYGPFRSKRQALETLRQLAEQHSLCLRTLGLESGKGRCFGQQVGKCRGVCCGMEGPALHHARVKIALTQHRLLAWPFRGPIGIREVGQDGETTQVHIFNQWCHMATLNDEMAFEQAIEPSGSSQGKTLAFDLDTYKMLVKYLAKPQHAAHVVRWPNKSP